MILIKVQIRANVPLTRCHLGVWHIHKLSHLLKETASKFSVLSLFSASVHVHYLQDQDLGLGLGLGCLMTPGLSKEGHSVS